MIFFRFLDLCSCKLCTNLCDERVNIMLNKEEKAGFSILDYVMANGIHVYVRW
jgi:hypothetical protein